MGELEKLVASTRAAIEEALPAPADFRPGKVSMWIKLVKLGEMEGARVELNEGPTQKVIVTAGSYQELLQAVAENLVLAVFGAEVSLVKALPNLIVKLFDRKRTVAVAGGPPLDQAGQLYLKATVYRWEPSLWEQLFPGKRDEE